ncbi:hypothetical protein CK203_094807 [Vitis vinifera]|uniref:Uncharacterized protein n=1 Tax=Vitis vinifera TaxID=29760 RepID=A0A438CZE5_VITVI|nr:hypothetical protein CK203_094807 [Vitis vinifera]
MVSPDVGSVEDVVRALLEYLVDPLLPAKSSSRSTPSLSQQQSVAKQVHAVVLLYNYYHRKQHQQLEFLATEKMVMDACDISTSLNASKDVPNTEGWPISKDVDATNHSLEGVKQIYRKKRTTKKSTRDETGSDEASLQQLAFSAVKKAADKE